MARSGLATYLKRAFLNHWNLLAVSGAAGFGLLSGRPDVVLPLVAAIELGYLAVVSTSARYQRHVDSLQGNAHALGEQDGKAQKLLAQLSASDRKRFEHLSGLCRDLLALGQEGSLTQPQSPTTKSFSGMRHENINRLLWIFLKLLYSKSALERFFATTREQDILDQQEGARKKLSALGPDRSAQQAPLEDLLQTCALRLDNFRKARDNHELVQIELERLYSKIASVAELGINRQDAQAASHEIDVAATSALETEKHIHQLDAITGFDVSDDAAPALLPRSRLRGY